MVETILLKRVCWLNLYNQQQIEKFCIKFSKIQCFFNQQFMKIFIFIQIMPSFGKHSKTFFEIA